MLVSLSDIQKKKSSASQPLYRQLKRKVVLIVEADPNLRALLKATLREGNFNFLEAGNEKDALLLLSRHGDIDLGLIDTNLPNMSGIQLLNMIQRQECLSKIPFIIISSETNPGVIIQSIKAGAADFIVKPFDKNVLIKKICKCLD